MSPEQPDKGPSPEVPIEARPMPEEGHKQLEARLEQPLTLVDAEIQALVEAAVARVKESGNDPAMFQRARQLMAKHSRATALAVALLMGQSTMPAAAEAGEPGEGRRKAADIAQVIGFEANAELERAYYEDIADLDNMEFLWQQAADEIRMGMERMGQLDAEGRAAQHHAVAAKNAGDADGVFASMERMEGIRAEKERIRLHLQDRSAFQKALERHMDEKEKGASKKRKFGFAARVGAQIIGILGR